MLSARAVAFFVECVDLTPNHGMGVKKPAAIGHHARFIARAI